MKAFLQPLHEVMANPAEAQQKVLKGLFAIYAQTDYGSQHNAAKLDNIKDYRRSFLVITYDDCKPIIRRVMAGEVKLFLHEDPVCWAITRGTTADEPKFIPMTPTDLKMRVSAGRAMLNYVVSTNRIDLFNGVNMNLNFPSAVGKVKVAKFTIIYI